ncbi:MAG TPA: MASE1 domain-containing protein [Gemmataceae bacterium]|nr:MASE1 domain-containing protein [Gemmataceae bacterium]
MRWRSVLDLVEMPVLAAVYFGAARLGLHLGFVEQVSAVWPPTGIALAAVLLFGYRIWPGIGAGAFLANAVAHEPLLTACGIALGNTLEAVIGAWLLQQLVDFRRPLARLRDVLGLVVLAAMLSTAVSATIGVASLCLGGVQPWAQAGSLWGVWWLGDAVGDLVMAPVLLTWAAGSGPGWRPRRLAEAAALFVALTGVCVVVFAGGAGMLGPNGPLEYTIFPLVIWAALRFEPPATAWVTFVASGIAIWGTLNGLGPFTRGTDPESLVLLQSFMGVVAVTGLVLAAATADRREADDSLRRSHSLLQAITDGTTDAVFVKDRCGRYLMINAAGARFLGKTVGEVLGKDDTQFFSPETASEIMEHDRLIMASGETRTYDDVGTAAGATRTYLSTKGPYRDPDGRVIGLIGISRDISDRKRMEQELRRQATELAEADRRKDEFLAMLAHELRNPLAPIRNAVYVMRRQALEDPLLRWARDVVERQVQQLARLVDDLLDVSRITRGKISLQKEPVELRAVAARAIETSQPLIDARNHALRVALPPGPIWLEADPTRLAQILANLLNNAAKYTEEGGCIWLSADPGETEVTVRVRDNGMGIPAEMLPRLFQPFTQADRSLARSQGGLGIGLTLVKSLVEMHGGSVKASSDGPGRGSEFVVRLPVAAHHEAVGPGDATVASSDGRPSPSAGPRRRVLVVDDNVDAAQSLASLLRLEGHHVQVAHDGPRALEAAQAQRPEVVLLDLGLPEMDGYEVARRLRQQPGLRTTLVVALTGYGQEEDRRRSREAGFDLHLIKPVDPAALLDVLARPPGG